MSNPNLLNRALPLALALTLIALTALWAGWTASASAAVSRWPFALCAASWPLLAWAGCRRRKRRLGTLQHETSDDPPRAMTLFTPRLISGNYGPSPDAQDESLGQRGAQFARLIER